MQPNLGKLIKKVSVYKKKVIDVVQLLRILNPINHTGLGNRNVGKFHIYATYLFLAQMMQNG